MVTQPKGQTSQRNIGLVVHLIVLVLASPNMTFFISRCWRRRRHYLLSKLLSSRDCTSQTAHTDDLPSSTASQTDNRIPRGPDATPLPSSQVSVARSRPKVSPHSLHTKPLPQLPQRQVGFRTLEYDDFSPSTSSYHRTSIKSEALVKERHRPSSGEAGDTSSDSLGAGSSRSTSRQTILPFQKKDPLPPSVLAARPVPSILKRPQRTPSSCSSRSPIVPTKGWVHDKDVAGGYRPVSLGGLQSRYKGRKTSFGKRDEETAEEKNTRKSVTWGMDEIRQLQCEDVELD